MSKRKTERLLGLVVCLLSTTRYLSAEQIRQAVPGYPEQSATVVAGTPVSDNPAES